MCHVLPVACCMPPAIYLLSLTPTAKYPPPAYSPIMHNRLVRKDLKNFKTQIIIEATKTQKLLEVCKH